MKTAALLLILTVFGNAQEIKNGQTSFHDRCPANICECETVQDNIKPTVFHMMATCTQVPSHLDNSTGSLKVTGHFDEISKHMITALGIYIHKLDFSNCKIKRIEKESFNSLLKNLKSLKLSNNKLTVLDKDIFNCANLEELFLDGNNLTQIHDDTFEKLKNLQFLYLQHNMLQKCTFNLPQTLYHLDLYDNEIQSFELDFNEVQLHHLNLCGNRLQQFPFKASIKKTNLDSLCLSDKATHLPEQFATRFPNLSNLTLEGSFFNRNELNDKTGNEIKKLSNLKTLSLEYFHIQSLEFIVNKPNLINLILKNITLDSMAGVQNAFRYIPYLTLLYIDGSPDLAKLVLADGSVVSQLTRLKYLSIQHTKLISIAKHNIPQSVVELNIAYNPLRCECNLAWIVAKQKAPPRTYLKDVAHTTCSKPAKFYNQELSNVVNPATCSGNSGDTFEQVKLVNNLNSTSEEQDMQASDHTVLYIILGSCLAILLVIGIILAIVLSAMKKKRMHQIAPEGGETPMEQQQQQIKQSSSHDMLLKK